MRLTRLDNLLVVNVLRVQFVGMSQDAYELQGQNGGQVIVAATGVVVGNFRWIAVVETAVLTSIVSNLSGASSILPGKSLAAGIGIGGNTTSIAVTSGTVVAYL